jgi:hypothetical protein
MKKNVIGLKNLAWVLERGDLSHSSYNIHIHIIPIIPLISKYIFLRLMQMVTF